MHLSECVPIFFSDEKNIIDVENFEDKSDWIYQISNLKKVYLYRKNLTKINYFNTLIDFIEMNEGCLLYPYKCPAGFVTIGAGILLYDGKNFNEAAIQAFNYLNKKNFFNEKNLEELVQNKIEIITKKEAMLLLKFVLNYFEKFIIKLIPFFRKLPLNIMISIQSLYYNNPIFLEGEFFDVLSSYFYTKNEKFLCKLLYKICRQLNKGAPYEDQVPKIKYWKGIQYRRYREMVMASNDYIDRNYFYKMYSYFESIY